MAVCLVECSGFQFLYILFRLITLNLLAVPSTDNNKIFLAGKDDSLYEGAYQAEAG